jgi:hypothetical protein
MQAPVDQQVHGSRPEGFGAGAEVFAVRGFVLEAAALGLVTVLAAHGDSVSDLSA